MALRLGILTLFLALTACNNGGAGSDAGSDGGGSDLLVGTWFEQVTPVTSDDQTVTLNLRADGTYSLTHTQVDPSTSATPGCTETQTDQGTYTSHDATGPMRLTLVPDTASGATARSGCTNATDDGPGTMGTPFAILSTPYTVTADTLVLTDTSGNPATTFMRH